MTQPPEHDTPTAPAPQPSDAPAAPRSGASPDSARSAPSARSVPSARTPAGTGGRSRTTAPRVTAVLVTRGPTRYLAETLDALGASTTLPGRVLVVDVAPDTAAGPVVDAAALAARWGTDVTLVDAPRTATFGLAVGAALDRLGVPAVDPRRAAPLGRRPRAAAAVDVPEAEWLWLLHDDSAPEPSALAELLRGVEHKPSVVLAGVKQRFWDDPARLVEVGLTTTPTGRRMTGIELGEVDQGQHDGAEDVLGVGLAGALVRLDAWQELRGTDPEYGQFGDGLELSRRARLAGHRVIVVPRASVRHAQATLTDRRRTDPDHIPDPERTVGARRRSALHHRLVGAAPLTVPLHMLAIVVAAPFLAAVHLGAKHPRRARAEIAAAAWAVLRPFALWRSRSRARRTARLPRSALLPLRATWRAVYAERRDLRLARAERRRHAAADPVVVAERRRDLGRRALTLTATVVALVAVTAWWFGAAVGPLAAGGRLVSGTLLTAGSSLTDLWGEVADGWVTAGTGAPAAADPLLTVLLPATAVAHLLGGGVHAVVTTVLLGSVVLAGTGAWLAAGAATRSLSLRTAAALVWVAVPAFTVGLADGRLGAVLAHALLPWALWGAVRGVGLGARSTWLTADGRAVAASDATGSIPAAALGGLALAGAVAGAPVLLGPALVTVAIIGMLTPRRRGVRTFRRNLALVALPVLLVELPLVLEVLRADAGDHWRVLLTDPGVPVASDAAPAWQQLLGWPVAPGELEVLGSLTLTGVPATVAASALVGLTGLVALIALARPGLRGRAVRGAWLVAAVALAAAAVAGTLVVGEGAVEQAHTWTGGAVSLVALALLAAALVGLDGVTARVAARAFGVPQLAMAAGTLVLVAALAVGFSRVPATTALAASSGPGLRVLTRAVVPEVGQQMQASPREARVLALDAADGAVAHQLLRGDGPRLVDTSVILSERRLHTGLSAAGDDVPDDENLERAVVASLVGGVGEEEDGLVALGVGAVVVTPLGPPDARAALVARLDTSAVLERVADGEFGTIWRVAPVDLPGATTSWARLVDDTGAAVVLPSAGRVVDVPTTGAGAPDQAAAAATPAPAGERTVVLAERADRGWRATLDGARLEPTGQTWAQEFRVPVGAEGRLRVWYEAPAGSWWRTTLVAFAGVYALLLIPVRRRGAGR